MIRDWLDGAAAVLVSGPLLLAVVAVLPVAALVVRSEVRARRREREARRRIREESDRETARWFRDLVPEQREGE